VSAIAEYRAASEANDIDSLMRTLAPDIELVSPLSAHLVFRGQDDLRALLSAVYGTVRGLKWAGELADGDTRFLLGTMRVGPFKLDDAMLFELGADGLIKRIRPHLRPWLATTFFALALGPKIARRPGVMLRALRGGA
jgi:SnoaL-like domain